MRRSEKDGFRNARCRALAAISLLCSYNDGWRFGQIVKDDGTTEDFERPQLAEAEFVAALARVLLDVTGADLLALSCTAGDMFWCHSVCVTSFDGLGLTDTNVELFG